MARPKQLNGGRPPIEIDEIMLQKLTSLHLPTVTIARILDASVDTLDRRFAEKMDKWRSDTNSKIAAALFDEGVNKREPWALKALAQKHLDYSDKVKTETELRHSFDNLTDEELDAKINDKFTKLKAP
jgi:hypothetical protein